MLKHSLPPLASYIFIAVQAFFKTKYSAMKKLCLIFFVFVMVNNSYGQISFGLKSGVNIATTKGLIEFPKNKVGWYGGGFVIIPVSNKLFLQTELLYSSKGQSTEKLGPQEKSVFRFNYLNVPILLGYKIDYKTSLLLGAELGYLLSAQRKYYSSQFMDVSTSFPSKFDAGLDVGINYKLLKNIGVEIRYSYGFKTMYSVDGVGVRHSENNGANRAFQIGVLYRLK